MRRLILLFMLLSLVSIVSAADTNTTNTLPAVSFDDLGETVYVWLSGWFKWVVLIVIVAGGTIHAVYRSEKDSALGLTMLKNAVLAVIVVLFLTWLVNALWSLPAT